MPLIAQICMVVVTTALAGMVVAMLVLMVQLQASIKAANRSLAELPSLIEDIKRTSARADELLIAFAHIARSARSGASQFEALATRSSSLAATVLDEIERPLARTVGLFRGIRVGASQLVQSWRSRDGSRTHTNQGDEHVGAQRWLDDGGVPDGSGGGGGPGPAPGAGQR